MTQPDIPFYSIPLQTIVPNPVDDTENFRQYLNRLYEDIAYAMNDRVVPFFTMSISDIATDIPNIPSFGAFLVCVSGIASSQPVKTWSLVKSDEGGAGVINILGTQPGTGDWALSNLTVTSTATNFQIAHDRAGITDTFNISVTGTQLGNQ